MALMESVFEKIDGKTRSFLGLNPYAILWNISNWRKYFAFCVVVASIAWVVFGFDSCWSQMKPIIEYFSKTFLSNPISELKNGIPFSELWEQSKEFYGIGNHFSAPVIYGLSFIVLSFHLEKIGITKSLNFCATTGLSLASIGIFELMWNSFYAFFHGQIWVITFQWKQVTNLVSFLIFTLIGALILLYLALEGYTPNLSKTTLSLFVLTIICWGFWVFYPYQVGHITVDTSVGPWTNSNKFPQTYYCVDIDPTDNIAIGTPNYVENDLIHFVNTFTKVVQTGFFLSLFMLKEVEK